MPTKKAPKEPKYWWKFFSVNGTVQDTKELTQAGAEAYAIENGFGSRYSQTEAPPKGKKK